LPHKVYEFFQRERISARQYNLQALLQQFATMRVRWNRRKHISWGCPKVFESFALIKLLAYSGSEP